MRGGLGRRAAAGDTANAQRAIGQRARGTGKRDSGTREWLGQGQELLIGRAGRRKRGGAAHNIRVQGPSESNGRELRAHIGRRRPRAEWHGMSSTRELDCFASQWRDVREEPQSSCEAREGSTEDVLKNTITRSPRRLACNRRRTRRAQVPKESEGSSTLLRPWRNGGRLEVLGEL
jgi:hypothetical protein